MALIGIFIATTAAKMGQEPKYEAAMIAIRPQVTMQQSELDKARKQLAELSKAGATAEQLDAVRVQVAAIQHQIDLHVSSYVRPGRHFAQWDGFRYEEIIDAGYLSHLPTDPPALRADPRIKDPRTGEPRLVNVSWYPLYPVLGFAVKFLSGLPHATAADWHNPDGFFWSVAQRGMLSVDALTLISRLSCILGAMVLFVLVRDHFAKCNKVAALAGGGDTRWMAENAAIWTVAFLYFAPDGVFLYSNFTEGVFALALASFLLCLQRKWWWRAALIAAFASASRSQGVLFGPMLAVCYLWRETTWLPVRLGKAGLLGAISAVGVACYMWYLHVKFGNALAFLEAQNTAWGAGFRKDTLLYAMNPVHAMEHLWGYLATPPTDWPRVWESASVFVGPLILLLGWRYLSIEQLAVGAVMWALPYFSTARMVYPDPDEPIGHWVSMGRYMVVCIPVAMILGALAARCRWLAPVLLPFYAAVFAVFAYLHGAGVWLG
jgi:hypothetical protein